MNVTNSKKFLAVLLVVSLNACVQRQTLRFESRPELAVSPASATGVRGAVPVEEPAGLFRRAPDETLTFAAAGAGLLEVHFVNVGQGDCTLIVCPNGNRMLVDSGSTTKNFSPSPVRSYLLSHLDPDTPRVDALVITHPDKDHYNFLPTVLDGVEIGHIYTSGTMSDHTEAGVEAWLDSFDSADRTRLSASAYNVATPKSLTDCGEAKILVLAANVPDTTVNSEPNTHSIVLKVSYGTVDFLLTGDATRDTENDIMNRLADDFLDVEVLKMGHHGSNATSTSVPWADTVKPEIAVASAGKNNTYGHPHRDVVQRLEPHTAAAEPHRFRWSWRDGGTPKFKNFTKYKEAIYSTAVNGNIAITTDGTEIEVVLNN
jgi:competence protein ComEC